MKTPWSSPEPIENLFYHLFDDKCFAKETGGTMEDSVSTKIGYSMITDNGLFHQICYEWHKLTRNQKSWIAFKINFTAADKDRVNHKTLQDAGYRNPNNVTTEINAVTTTCTIFSEYIGIRNISALTEAISDKPTIIKLI